jgi:hypothetical protein
MQPTPAAPAMPAELMSAERARATTIGALEETALLFTSPPPRIALLK